MIRLPDKSDNTMNAPSASAITITVTRNDVGTANHTGIAASETMIRKDRCRLTAMLSI
jgi:hypothetical protein